jgi:hypothetical protein
MVLPDQLTNRANDALCMRSLVLAVRVIDFDALLRAKGFENRLELGALVAPNLLWFAPALCNALFESLQSLLRGGLISFERHDPQVLGEGVDGNKTPTEAFIGAVAICRLLLAFFTAGSPFFRFGSSSASTFSSAHAMFMESSAQISSIPFANTVA